MRRGWEEFLVYHLNASVDGRLTKDDATKTARLRIDLEKAGGAVEGGKEIELTAPWTGCEVVLRLRKG